MKLNIKDVTRTGHVKRWQIVRTARAQTLAEHLYISTMIAQYIYERTYPALMDGEIPDPREELLLLKYMLRHDVPEVITGDIVGTVKQKLRALVEYDPFEKLEKEIDPEYGYLKSRIKGTPLERIAKLADFLEGIVFLNVEGMGAHAEVVKQKLIERYAQYYADSFDLFPDWQWGEIRDLIHEIMHGDDGLIEVEGETQ